MNAVDLSNAIKKLAEGDFFNPDAPIKLKVAAGGSCVSLRLHEIASRNCKENFVLTESQLEGIYAAERKFVEAVDAILQVSFPKASVEELLATLS